MVAHGVLPLLLLIPQVLVPLLLALKRSRQQLLRLPHTIRLQMVQLLGSLLKLLQLKLKLLRLRRQQRHLLLMSGSFCHVLQTVLVFEAGGAAPEVLEELRGISR